MHTTTPSSSAPRYRERRLLHRIRHALFRRLWLPRYVYEILPYVYMMIGFLALYVAANTPSWTWILPYAALLGLMCLHIGLWIVVMRYRFRRRGDD